MMDISVVVPTRNRAENLERFFESLTKQTYTENYELIVIDNGSVDATKNVCEKWKDEIKDFHYIYDGRPGLHVGRNIGYQQSKADLIVFADDDIVAIDTWLESILDGFRRHSDVALIGGNIIPEYEEAPPKWIKDLYYYDKQYGAQILAEYSCIILGRCEKEISSFYVFGCNFAVRKCILDRTFGFHPDGFPDELLSFRGDGESFISEYIMKEGWKTLFVPEASVYHYVSRQRMSLDHIKKIAFRNGISYAYAFLRSDQMMKLKAEIIRKKFALRGTKKANELSIIRKVEEIRGMEYLLVNYKKCEEVRKWIHRIDYLGINATIPNIKEFLID